MSEFLFAIDNILTKEECNRYIKLFDNPSNVEKINDKHRKYFRVQFQDQELADKLYQKVQHYIPKKN